MDAFSEGVVTVITDLTAGRPRTDDWSLGEVGDERLRFICVTDTVAVAEATRAHARPLRRRRGHHARMLICEEAWLFAEEHAASWERMTGSWWNNGSRRGWGWDHDTFLVLTTDRRDDIDLSGLDSSFVNVLELWSSHQSTNEGEDECLD